MRISKFVAFALYCGALSLSSAAVAAPSNAGRGARIDRICAKISDPARQEVAQARLEMVRARVDERLHLTDSQKNLFKAFLDARADARKAGIDSICASKPDLRSLEGRLALHEQMLENRLNGAKAADPKLLAFYNSLDNGQKSVFDEMRRHWRHHWRHRHGGWREYGRDASARGDWQNHHHRRDD